MLLEQGWLILHPFWRYVGLMYCIDEFICCVCFAQVTIVNNVEEVRMHVLIKYVVLRVHLHVCSYSKGQPLRCTFVSEECTF